MSENILLQNKPETINKNENQMEKIYSAFDSYDARYSMANILAGESIGVTPAYRTDIAGQGGGTLRDKFNAVGKKIVDYTQAAKNAGNWGSRYLSDRFLTVGYVKKGLEKKNIDVESAADYAGLGSAKQMTAMYADMLSSEKIGIKSIVEGENLDNKVTDYIVEMVTLIGSGWLIRGESAKTLAALSQLGGVASTEVLMAEIRPFLKGKKDFKDCKVLTRIKDVVLNRLEAVKGQVKMIEYTSKVGEELDQSSIAEGVNKLKNLSREDGTGIIKGDARQIISGSLNESVAYMAKKLVSTGYGMSVGAATKLVSGASNLLGITNVVTGLGVVNDQNNNYSALLNYARENNLNSQQAAALLSAGIGDLATKYDRSIGKSEEGKAKKTWNVLKSALVRTLTISEKAATGASVVGDSKSYADTLRQFANYQTEQDRSQETSEVTNQQWLDNQLEAFAKENSLLNPKKIGSNLRKGIISTASLFAQGFATGAVFKGGTMLVQKIDENTGASRGASWALNQMIGGNASAQEVVNPPSTAPYLNREQNSAPAPVESAPAPTIAAETPEPAPAPAETVSSPEVSNEPVKLSSVAELDAAFESGKLQKGTEVILPNGKRYELVGNESGEVSEATRRVLTQNINQINQESGPKPAAQTENTTTTNSPENVTKFNSIKDIESAVVYGNIKAGDKINVGNRVVEIVGDREGKIGVNTIKQLEQYLENPVSTPESEAISAVTTKIEEIVSSTGANEVITRTIKAVETIIPLSSEGKDISLIKIELPTSFGNELTLADVGDPEQVPPGARVITDDIDGAIFYEYQKEGKSVIRAALQGDTPGTAREIMNPNITFELTTDDGVKLDAEISSRILHEGLSPADVYNEVAKANPENSDYFVVQEGNSLDMANSVEVAPGVDLRSLVTNASEFTASYDNKYQPGTTAFMNIILASDNATRNEYIDALAADRRHVLDNPGEQNGFPNEYRQVLRELEDFGFFKEGFNGQDLNRAAREIQLDSGTTFMENSLNKQRKLLLDSAVEIFKNRTKTELINNPNVIRNNAKFFNGTFMREVAEAKTPEQYRALTKELSNANFNFSGAEKLSFREVQARVDAQRDEFEKMVPYMNAYIQQTGGEDKIVLDERGLVQNMELEEFDSSMGLNLPDVTTAGGAIQALSMAWGITKGQIPIPLKFEQSGKIGYGQITESQMASLFDKNNPNYEVKRTGISPQAQKILAPILGNFVPFALTGKTEISSSTAGEIYVDIPVQLLDRVEATENGIFLLEDLINNKPEIFEKLKSPEGLGIKDIEGKITDRDGNVLEGEQLESYLKAMRTYYVQFEKAKDHARAGKLGPIASLEKAMNDPETGSAIRKELAKNEYQEIIKQNSNELVKSMEEERKRLNSLLTGQNAIVDGSIILQAKGIPKNIADEVMIAMKNGDRSVLEKYNVTLNDKVMEEERLGRYYTNPTGYTPDEGHKLGLQNVLYAKGFKYYELIFNDFDGVVVSGDYECENIVLFADAPPIVKPEVCVTGEVCMPKIYNENKIDADIARAKQTSERLTDIGGDINQMAEHNLALTIANENAEKGTIPFMLDAAKNAPDGDGLDEYIKSKGLDKIQYGNSDFTLGDIIKESKTNPDVENFLNKIVASNKINAALVEHTSKDTFTLTIGLPKTTESVNTTTIKGAPDQVVKNTSTLSNGAVQTVTSKTVFGDTTITDTFKSTTSNSKADISMESSLTAIVGAQSFAEFVDGCKVVNLKNDSAGMFNRETSDKAGVPLNIKTDSQTRDVQTEKDVTTTETVTTEPPKPPEPPVTPEKPEPPVTPEPPKPEPELELTDEVDNTAATPADPRPPQPEGTPEGTTGQNINEPTPPSEQPPAVETDIDPTVAGDKTPPTPPAEPPSGPVTPEGPTTPPPDAPTIDTNQNTPGVPGSAPSDSTGVEQNFATARDSNFNPNYDTSGNVVEAPVIPNSPADIAPAPTPPTGANNQIQFDSPVTKVPVTPAPTPNVNVNAPTTNVQPEVLPVAPTTPLPKVNPVNSTPTFKPEVLPKAPIPEPLTSESFVDVVNPDTPDL